MRHQNQGAADAAIEFEQQIGDALPGVGIQIAGRLVREQHGGMRHEGAGDGHALLFAAGQLLRVVRGARRQPHLFERLRRRGAGIAPGRAIRAAT